jgi:hypothetical protein
MRAIRAAAYAVPVLLFHLALSSLLRAEDLTLPVTADNSICMHPGEVQDNCGQSSRVKLKGTENVILLNFDAAALKGKAVTKAVLRIKGAAKNLMVRKVGFSTVATEWNEGKQGNEAKAAPGESCFLAPAFEQRKWAGADSSFLDAVWGRGGTIWSQTYVQPDGEMWYEMEFDPRIAEACALGLSHGLVLSDDNGQTKNIVADAYPATNFSNNFFYSREQGNAKPVFRFTVEPAKPAAPATLKVEVKPWPGGADFKDGGLEISWPGPKDPAEAKATIGYKVSLGVNGEPAQPLPRWMLPTVAFPGEKVRVLLKGQTAGAKVEALVEVFSKGSSDATAKGQGSGTVSPKLDAPAALALADVQPAAGDPPADATVRVWAMPDCCKANPITGNVQEEDGVNYEGDVKGTFAQANAVWSGKDRTVSLTALRGEWVAFQIVCQNLTKDSVKYAVKPGALEGPSSIPATAVELSRVWYQKTGKSARGWYADPLIPLKHGESFSVPDAKNAVSGQTTQTVYVEWFVPKDAKSGAYNGQIEVQANDGAPVALKVKLDVAGAQIPDQAHFTWSMNAYSSPGSPYGAAGSPEFIAAERAFYVMSHLHRTCLAVLHYSHGGDYQAGCAPPLTGSGKQMKVSDWSAWDARFGPLFDASAFKGTPREGVPMDHFYLVMAEHYPTAMKDGYKWDNAKWEEHWKVAGPIEEGFSQAYKDQWVAVAADHMRHFAEKGWKTEFQIYLNDKYFYKQYDKNKKGHGRGVSFWLLDEPMHIDDYHALAFFGWLFRDAQKLAGEAAGRTTEFRVDVSRPQWGRDVLDRIVDLNVTGGFSDYRPWLEDWRERYGQEIWTYGGAPTSTQSALGIVAQALDLYGRGVDGFVPWLTLGNEGNWTNFEDTCVYYQGKPQGIAGPCASLRLKAYRRGEQDVEYIWLLAEKRGLLKDDPSRLRVGEMVKSAIRAKRELGKLDAQGAVTESLKGLRPSDFEALRRAVAKELTP